jgi:hypothetical protein
MPSLPPSFLWPTDATTKNAAAAAAAAAAKEKAKAKSTFARLATQ